MAKTKELEIHDTAHIEEINKRIEEVQKRRSAEKQTISPQEEKIVDKMTKPYQEKIVNPDEVLIGPAGIYDPSKKQDDPLLDMSRKVKEGLKEYSQTNLADVLIGPAGYGPGHPKYEGPKKGEKKPKDEIYLGPAGYGPGHPKYVAPNKESEKQNKHGRTTVRESHLQENIKENFKNIIEATKQVNPKEKDEVILGPGGNPDKWKFVKPEWHHSNTDNIVKDSQKDITNNDVAPNNELDKQNKHGRTTVRESHLQENIKENFKNIIEATKQVNPKEKDEVILGPGGNPNKWDNSPLFSQNPSLSEKLNIYSKKLENNDSSQENAVSMIQSNNTER